ncbi:hypothetical protein HF086_012350 [Spodoptera exigua]|uniref:Uncharacterized protein n=1 Tax=Spodoptera exigua TaxID=7107 RepID=A0A922M9M1_SPOEX|nr:hypothetical protein HF086_012350 [Spodoptera exigua]
MRNITVEVPSTGVSASTQPPEEEDFLGETSSAYTAPPLEYSELDDYEDGTDDEDSFHAAEGLELDQLRAGNVSGAAPRGLRAVIVKHRFVTLSWQPPQDGDVAGNNIITSVYAHKEVSIAMSGDAGSEYVAAARGGTS